MSFWARIPGPPPPSNWAHTGTYGPLAAGYGVPVPAPDPVPEPEPEPEPEETPEETPEEVPRG